MLGEIVTATEHADATGVCQSDSAGSPPPLLLRAPAAAALLSTPVRTWRMWNVTGKIPRAIHMGRSNYWRSEELKAWVAAGCPDRVVWETMQQL